MAEMEELLTDLSIGQYFKNRCKRLLLFGYRELIPRITMQSIILSENALDSKKQGRVREFALVTGLYDFESMYFV